MFKKRKNKVKKIDTSINGYKYIGIKLTQDQYDDLCTINLLMNHTCKEEQVHCVLLVLKTLGLIPPELICEVGDNESAGNSENVSDDKFQKRFGRIKEVP